MYCPVPEHYAIDCLFKSLVMFKEREREEGGERRGYENVMEFFVAYLICPFYFLIIRAWTRSPEQINNQNFQF